MTTTSIEIQHETRQVERAVRDALHKFNDDPHEAARAYGLDVRKMLSYDSAYWDKRGLVRLYARTAARLADLALQSRA